MSVRGRLRSKMMLFTLFGDYVYYRGGEVWAGSLVRLMDCFGVSEPSVRTELLRMCRKGYLNARRLGKRSFYALSPRGQEVIEAGARRIFIYGQGSWDGRWTVLTYQMSEEQREMRDRLRRDLTWLGFAQFAPGVYLSPWPHTGELPRILEGYRPYGLIQAFRSEGIGPLSAQEIVSRCWDLEAVNAAYGRFLAEWRPRRRAWREGGAGSLTDQGCFVERYLLSHDYKSFPLLDPGLPRELLAANWLGQEAAELFQAHRAALEEQAMRFFGSIHEGWPQG